MHDLADVDFGLIERAFAYASTATTKARLLTRVTRSRNKEETISLFAKMERPFDEIGASGRRPKIANTPENTALAKALKDCQIISSFSINGDEIQIFNFKVEQDST